MKGEEQECGVSYPYMNEGVTVDGWASRYGRKKMVRFVMMMMVGYELFVFLVVCLRWERLFGGGRGYTRDLVLILGLQAGVHGWRGLEL